MREFYRTPKSRLVFEGYPAEGGESRDAVVWLLPEAMSHEALLALDACVGDGKTFGQWLEEEPSPAKVAAMVAKAAERAKRGAG